MLRRLALAVGLTALAFTQGAPTVRAGESATAILAGGCFWCVEHDFRELPGVVDAVSGYSGGSRPNPTYENYHDTDAANPVPHVESVLVTYDPAVISYDKVLDYYFHHIDPTDGGGQFCDRGPAYRPVIFVANEAEREVAKKERKQAQATLHQDIAVEVLPAAKFWPAEAYHQDYAEKNALKYKFYRWNCGRDQRVSALWGAAIN